MGRATSFVPKQLLGPDIWGVQRALYYRWGLMLAAHTLGFETAARGARAAGQFLWNNIPLVHSGIRDTIAVALGETHGRAEIDAIARRYAIEMSLNYLETDFVHRKISAGNWRTQVRCCDMDRLADAVRSGTGVVAASAYFGNHQVGMTAFGLMLGSKVAGIVSPLQHPVQQRWMAGMVRRRLAKLYPQGDAMHNAMRALGDGNLVLIIGEHLSQSRSAVEVTFLGKLQRFYPSAALLAWRKKCPLAVVTCHRLEAPFRFELRVREWLEPSGRRRYDWVREATVRAMTSLDAAIRERPEQYAWAHRHLLAGQTREAHAV